MTDISRVGSQEPIPVAERYKVRVYGQSFDGVSGSNPTRDMDDCVVCCRGISDMKTENIKVHNG
jgi:hypothetical protein